MDLQAMKLDAARYQAPMRAPTSAAAQGQPRPQQLGVGDRRRGLPPRPPPPPSRGETRSGGVGKADEVRGTRDTRHGSGVAKRDAAAVASGDGVPGVARKDKGVVFPPAPPPKRRLVSATRRFPPGPPGHGRDAAADDVSRLVVARADGASDALKKTAPSLPVGKAGSSVVQVESSAEVASAPIAGSGHHGLEAELQRSSEPLCQSSVPSADGLLGTDSKGDAESAEFETKGMVPAATRPLLPKPRMVSAVRRFPPGCGRAGTSLVVGGGSSEGRLPLPEKVVATNCSTSAADKQAIQLAAVPCNATSTDQAGQKEQFVEGEIAAPKVQALHESAACRDGPSVPVIGLPSQEKRPSCVVAKDIRVVIKSAGSSSNAVAQSLSEGPSKEHMVSAKMGRAFSGVAENAGSSVMQVESSAEVGSAPIAGSGHPGLEAELQRSPEPLCQSSVPSADGLLDTDSKGDAESAGFGRKGLVPAATRPLLPKPRMVSAVRCFPPGCGRVGASLVAGGSSSEVHLPLPEKVVATDCSTSAADKQAMKIAAVPCNATSTDQAAQNEEFIEGNIAAPKVQPQGSQSCTNGTLHESSACRDGPSVPAISLPSQEKRPSCVVAKDIKVVIKSAGSSSHALAQSLSKGPSKKHMISAKMGRAFSGVAPGVSGQGAMRRDKIMSAAQKEIRPTKLIQKFAEHRPFSKIKEKETEHGRCVTTNGSEYTAGFAKHRVVEAPTSGKKCVRTDREATAKSMNSFGPKKKLNANQKHMLPSNVEHDILKALAAHEEKYGAQNVDARSKIKMMRGRFEFIRTAIIRAVKQQSLKLPRIDLAAADLIKKTPGFTQHGPIVGEVHGVEVGDEFLYRVELNIVGLHRPYQGGIDATRDKNNVLVAISVVASGGYPDQLSRSGELVYTGSGGKISGKKGEGDQKLVRGNLALKNCIRMKTPVRVIHSFKSRSREEISMFTYDGLYNVVDCWREGQPGSKVFKYKLLRIPGQAELQLR